MIEIVHALNGTRIKSMDELTEFLENSALLLSEKFTDRIMTIVRKVMVESYEVGKQNKEENP
jgi:hypothetical protein